MKEGSAAFIIIVVFHIVIVIIVIIVFLTQGKNIPSGTKSSVRNKKLSEK